MTKYKGKGIGPISYEKQYNWLKAGIQTQRVKKIEYKEGQSARDEFARNVVEKHYVQTMRSVGEKMALAL